MAKAKFTNFLPKLTQVELFITLNRRSIDRKSLLDLPLNAVSTSLKLTGRVRLSNIFVMALIDTRKFINKNDTVNTLLCRELMCPFCL